VYKRRLSRRRFLTGAAAVAGVGLAAACGGSKKKGGMTPGQTPPAGNGQPKRGAVVRMATTAPALSLDPHTDATLGLVADMYMYGHMVHPTDWGERMYGDLAKSWELVDEVNWVFHIRQGAHFHNVPPVDGREAVAGDIVYSFKRLESIPGSNLVGWSDWIDRYEAPDDRTLTVHTTKPYAYTLLNMGSPRMAVVPKEAVDTFSDLKSNAIGTGPFQLKSWDRNTGIEVERNPNYFDPEIPYLDGLEWSVMPDDSAIQAAFRSGAVDIYGAPDKVRANSVSSVSGASAQRFLNRAYAVLVLNAVRTPAFKDQRVREAVDLALDREAMIQKLFLGDAELCGPVGPSWDTALPADEIKKAYTRDIARSKQLLSAAGQENLSFKLLCASYADNPDRATIIQQNLKDAGINVELQTEEIGTWLSDMYAVNYEADTFAHLAYLGDGIPLQSHYSTGFNRAMFLGITDAEVDSLLLQVQTTIDDDARKQLAWDVQRKILQRHGPTLVLYEPYGYLVAYDHIKNYTPSPWIFGMYRYDMWLDKG